MGEFSHGHADGKGVKFFADGQTWLGKFSNGKLVSGVIWWPNGNVFTGDFIAGEDERKGVFVYSNGTISEGTFVDSTGDHEGVGAAIYTNNAIYIGHFKKGLRHGAGIEHYSDGSELIGDFAFGTPTNSHVYLVNDRAVKPNRQTTQGNRITFSYSFGNRSYTTSFDE